MKLLLKITHFFFQKLGVLIFLLEKFFLVLFFRDSAMQTELDVFKTENH